MTENQDKINQLLYMLETLGRRQEMFSKEIIEIRAEIYKLKTNKTQSEFQEQPPEKEISIETEKSLDNKQENISTGDQTDAPDKKGETPKYYSKRTKKQPGISINLEKFIGENLINKIGIVLLRSGLH